MCFYMINVYMNNLILKDPALRLRAGVTVLDQEHAHFNNQYGGSDDCILTKSDLLQSLKTEPGTNKPMSKAEQAMYKDLQVIKQELTKWFTPIQTDQYLKHLRLKHQDQQEHQEQQTQPSQSWFSQLTGQVDKHRQRATKYWTDMQKQMLENEEKYRKNRHQWVKEIEADAKLVMQRKHDDKTLTSETNAPGSFASNNKQLLDSIKNKLQTGKRLTPEERRIHSTARWMAQSEKHRRALRPSWVTGAKNLKTQELHNEYENRRKKALS